MRTRRRRQLESHANHAGPGFGASLFFLGAFLSVACDPRPTPFDLKVGRPLTREMAAGEVHTYPFQLEMNEFLHVVVDQLQVDVELALVDPGGREMVRVDSMTGPTGGEGSENLLALVSATGGYLLKIHALDVVGDQGYYEVRLDVLRRAGKVDELRARAATLLAQAENARRNGELDEAVAKYRAALPIFTATGQDPEQHAQSLFGLAWILEERRAWQGTIEVLDQAVVIFAQLGKKWHEANARDRLARAYEKLGDFEAAVDHYEAAQTLWPEVKDRVGQAFNFNNLGFLYHQLGEFDKALACYDQALVLWTTINVSGEKARVLHNRGRVYAFLGNFAKAHDDLEQALETWGESGDLSGQAAALNALAQLAEARNELSRATDFYRRALALRIDTGDRRGQGVTLASLGVVYERSGEVQRALDHQRRALDLFRQIKDRRQEATALHNMGSIFRTLDRNQEALEHYGAALSIYQEFRDPARQAETLLGMARVLRRQGRLQAALARLDQALLKVEALRVRSASHGIRSSYFATKQRYYEVYIDLLMDLHRLDPEAGYAAGALAASERARARSLLDTLLEGGLNLRRGVDAELLEREHQLGLRLKSFDLQRRKLTQSGSAEEMENADRQLRELLRRWDDLQVEIRRKSPQYADLTQPEPLSAVDIQRQVLDEETLLLQYKLGAKRSFVWAVTPDAITSFTLPGRRQIESSARRVYDLMKDRNLPVRQAETHPALAGLSELLLGQVAPALPGKRLLIVGEGALQYVPFGALPLPGTCSDAVLGPGCRPLVAEHEIVTLPSASSLVALRRKGTGKGNRLGRLAVVADPVFQADDPRVEAEGSRTPEQTGAVRRGYERLKFSQQEAQAILGLVPVESRLSAQGFDANLETVLSGRLAGYSVVHFATHAEVNTEYPWLSHLVLSQFDAAGRPRDGFLYVPEIYNLDLPADLVVLSGCETALGKEVRGEGLVGLTRGFMYAGAARVVVSLWSINDRAGAELMKRFYRSFLDDGRAPSAALRLAQDSMRREPGWEAPYFWAGFVVQGVWGDVNRE